jgi:hypothetical protein
MLTVQDNLIFLYFQEFNLSFYLLLHFKNSLKLNSPKTFRIPRAPPGKEVFFLKPLVRNARRDMGEWGGRVSGVRVVRV